MSTRQLYMRKYTKLLICSLFFFTVLIIPKNVEAFQCKYNVYPSTGNSDEPAVELIFEIKKEGDKNVLLLPFQHNDYIPSDDYMIQGQYANSFEDEYLKEAAKNDGAKCPTLVVQRVPGYIIMEPPSVVGFDNYTAELIDESSDGEDDGFDVVTVQNSCTLTVPIVDVFNDNAMTDETANITFRIYSNYLKTWQVNDSQEVTLMGNDTAQYQIALRDDSGTMVRYFVSLDILNNMYKANSLEMTCPTQIYACKEEMASIGLHNYTLYSSPICDEQDRIEGANLDGLNQAIACNGLFYDYYYEEREEGSVYDLLQTLLDYIKILGPILVVILSAVDFIKAVASSDEDAMKKAQHRLVIRLIAALALFLIPTFVQLILELIGGLSDPTCLLQ